MALPADVVRGTQAAEQQALRHADGAARAHDRLVATTTPRYERLNVFVSGGNVALTAGVKSMWMPGKNYRIRDYNVVADQTGDLELDLLTCSHADYPTGASIVGADPPTITADVKTPDNPDISGWDRDLARGEWFLVSVTSATDIIAFTLALLLQEIPPEPPN